MIRLLLCALVALPAVATADPKPVPPTVTPAPDPWAGRTDLFVPPTVKPSTSVRLGAVTRFALPNGLRVIAVPRRGAPTIDLVLAVRMGPAAEPREKAGLADFTASMLRKGTVARSADQIAELIDSSGGELDAEAREEATFVSCHGRTRDLALCLDLLSDVTLRPSFPDAELGDVRDQLFAGIESERDNPQRLAARHGENVYFGDDDPRGWVASKRTVGAIDRAALVAFHATWYRPNNTIVAISGDFEPAALRAALSKWFGAWKTGEVPKLAPGKLPPPGPLALRLVDKPDATQAQIYIVGPGVRRGDADTCATRLMSYSLGEGVFSSRLMKVVRSENAKTYHASTHFQLQRDPGTFTAVTFTREPEAASTIRLMLGEIERMRDGGPTAEELAGAKANLIGGYGLRFETGADLARQLLGAALDEMPEDYLDKVPACLDAVTVAQAAQAARAHLQPQTLVVVGNAKALAPQLAAAKLKVTETCAYTDPVSPAERKALAKAQDAAAAATPAEIEQGRQLLDLALKAKGAASIAKVVDLHVNAVGSLTASGNNVHIGYEGFFAPGRAQREDMSVGGQLMSQVFVDGKAFVKAETAVKDLPAQMATEMKRELWRNPHLVVLNAAAPGVALKRLPPVVDGKQRLDALQVVSPDGEMVRLLFDAQSHQLAKVLHTEDGKESSEALSDYKPEGGIAFARHLVSQSEGQRVELTIDKIQVNRGLPKDAFSR